MGLALAEDFSRRLGETVRALKDFEAEDAFLASARAGGHSIRADYAFWLYHRTASAFIALALILSDNLASGRAGETSLAYGLLRHMLENYADLYNGWSTKGLSYWYWRYLSAESAGERAEADAAYERLRRELPGWASYRGRDGRLHRATRLTRYARMAPLPPSLSSSLPALAPFHRTLRQLDRRASAAFHSNSPAFLRDVRRCNEEILRAMHLMLASSLAIVTAVYRNPWSFDLRGRLWPPLLANLAALEEGRAFRK